jgi:hypothetical protein
MGENVAEHASLLSVNQEATYYFIEMARRVVE